MPEFIQWISALLLIITSFGILYDLEWKINSILMGIQYFAAFFLLMVYWPINMSGSVLVAGWISVILLVITVTETSGDQNPVIQWLALGKMFRVFTAVLILLVTITSYTNISNWFPSASPPLMISSLCLILIGFLMIGMTQKTDKVIFGLLTILTGFEISFTQVDNSVLMVALTSLIMMSVALVGSYLLFNEANQV